MITISKINKSILSLYQKLSETKKEVYLKYNESHLLINKEYSKY